jgi:hypothetical protein
MSGKTGRSAVTGKFVTQKTVTNNPKTTVNHDYGNSGSKPKPKK